jgi:hypothetical protein
MYKHFLEKAENLLSMKQIWQKIFSIPSELSGGKLSDKNITGGKFTFTRNFTKKNFLEENLLTMKCLLPFLRKKIPHEQTFHPEFFKSSVNLLRMKFLLIFFAKTLFVGLSPKNSSQRQIFPDFSFDPSGEELSDRKICLFLASFFVRQNVN